MSYSNVLLLYLVFLFDWMTLKLRRTCSKKDFPIGYSLMNSVQGKTNCTFYTANLK